MATYDEQYLSEEQQKEIQAAKDAWAKANAAGDQAGMDAAHAQAEAIRNAAGYSGGADGSGYAAYGGGNGGNRVGNSYEDVEKWYQNYMNQMYGQSGWDNGFSSAMNTRSMANYIRQRMQENSEAWGSADAGTRDYLHQQNVQLAALLEKATGGAKSTYNDKLGRWETANANLGYGYNVGQYNDEEWYGGYYGMTPEQQEAYRSDTSRYRNFVDQSLVRNFIDESSGYTGMYSQFVNGPYAALLGGTKGLNSQYYTDVEGDGFHDGEFKIAFDADGNPIKYTPYLKNNNGMSDYQRQFASYVDENGVIQPGLLTQTKGGRRGEEAERYNYLSGGTGGTGGTGSAAVGYNGSGMVTGGSTGSGGGYQDYINQMYENALKSQLSQLETAYNENVSELDSTGEKLKQQYDASIRQTQGNSDFERQKWNEMANAYGLNSGAIGQAGLARSNQLQTDLNNLRTTHAQNQAELERQRLLLGQQYQAAILEAKANNDYQRAQMLYQEAVRVEEALTQKQQFASQQMMQLLQMMMQYGGSSAASAASEGSSNSQNNTINGMQRVYDKNYPNATIYKQNITGGAGADFSGVYVEGLGRLSPYVAEQMANKGTIIRNGLDQFGNPTYIVNPNNRFNYNMDTMS